MERKRFNFADGAKIYLFAVACILGVQLVLSFILALFNAEWILKIDWVSILLSLLIQIVLVSVTVVYCKKMNTRFEYGTSATKPLGYVIPVAAAAVCFGCFILSSVAFDLLLGLFNYESGGGIVMESLPAKILGVIVTVICAPRGEELVFRGALLSGLKQRYKAPAAIVLSGLAFSLMHMNPEQTVYQFILGCVCAYFTLQSGSLLPAIITHGVSNLIACLTEIIVPLGEAVDKVIYALIDIPWLFAVLTVVLLAVGLVALFFLGKLLAKQKNESAEKQKDFAAVPPRVSFDGEVPSSSAVALHEAESNKKMGRVMYVLAISVTAVVWLATFAIAVLTGNGLIRL